MTAAAEPEPVERVAWRPDADVGLDEQGRLLLAAGARRFAIGAPDLDGEAVLAALREPGDACPGLRRRLAGSAAAAGQLDQLLVRLADRGWLETTVWLGDRPVASLRPRGHDCEGPSWPLRPDLDVGLSRLALIRFVEGSPVVESPRTAATVVLHDPRVGALVAALAAPARVELAGRAAGLSAPVATAVARLLHRAGLLVAHDGADEEATTVALAQWSLPDLLFHARSRYGRHVGGYGATYPLRGRFPEPPAAGPAPPGTPTVALPRVDLEAAAAADPPLTTVLESRRSVRVHDDASPITLDQLGEILWRAAAVRPGRGTFADGSPRPEGAHRPYPSGGALYELELYPAVRACQGLDPGLYHYDAFAHRLIPVAGWGPDVDALVEDGRRRSTMSAPPQVLLVVAARFGPVMHKYESMAYAAILKNVGVLYQTLYCVATAMGLSPCALGGGDSDAFARASGRDYYAESSVGEFLLGSRTDPARCGRHLSTD